MVVSEYGDLLDVKPMIKGAKNEVLYREVQMIGDNTESRQLLKKMHCHPNMYFLYDPKAHFTNAQSLYLAMKKLVNEKYYGRPRRSSKSTEKNEYKGTLFEKC